MSALFHTQKTTQTVKLPAFTVQTGTESCLGPREGVAVTVGNSFTLTQSKRRTESL